MDVLYGFPRFWTGEFVTRISALGVDAAMQNDIWSSRPDDVRSEVDSLVRHDHRLRAVMAIREACRAEKPGLYEALDVLVERYRALGQSLFTPTKPLDLDQMLATVAALPVRPDAVEAVWDGDTDGWFVRLLAVTADPQREFPLARITCCYPKLGSVRLHGHGPFRAGRVQH